MQARNTEMNKTFRIAEACLVMRRSQIKFWSYLSELFVKQTFYPTVICFKNLVKIPTAYWRAIYIRGNIVFNWPVTKIFSAMLFKFFIIPHGLFSVIARFSAVSSSILSTPTSGLMGEHMYLIAQNLPQTGNVQLVLQWIQPRNVASVVITF